MFIFAGCYEKVDWDAPPFESKPVMNSILVAGKPVKVHVSLAVPYGANKSIIVEDAEVNLFVDGVFAETLVYQEEGNYQSQLVAEIDKEYVCEVHVDNYPVVRGSTIIPKPVKILGIEHINIAGVDEEGLTFPAVKITFENNPDIFTCNEVIINTISRYGQVGQQYSRAWISNFTDPVLLNEGLPITVFSNEIIENDSYTMTINYSTGHRSSDGGPMVPIFQPLKVEFRTLSQSYYQYARRLYLYEYNNDEPFFSGGVLTPFTLYSNIENGYGIFAGYSFVTSAVIIPEE
ncbi:MAG: DUF4249 domain-containing protein [Bacteroidales bacterium]